MKRGTLNSIGIMTGNSLDGADLVLTHYAADGSQTDLVSLSLPNPPALRDELQWVRGVINDEKGDLDRVLEKCHANGTGLNFSAVSDHYIEFIADAVNQLVHEAKSRNIEVDVIGFHGQTCAHCPPSIAKSKEPSALYTVQMGDGQKLADLTEITVVYDFRSDDLMNFGEAAPLAPVHHQHLAEQTRKHGHFPIAFCNAGNTGNITIIAEKKTTQEVYVQGWDTGPFNNFPDKLVQAEKGEDCDRDGKYGSAGQVQLDLLEELFNNAVLTRDGENFLLKPPPRSSDPQWYTIIPALSDPRVCFEDRVRTAEYFSAYIYFHALSFVSEEIRMPAHFAVCGGGWKNPVSFDAFKKLIAGDFKNTPILPQHRDTFETIRDRIQHDNQQSELGQCNFSEFYGFDGTAMEARIFADAAVCRLVGEPFSLPSTTGVTKPTVAGIIRFPHGDRSTASQQVVEILEKNQSWDLTLDVPSKFDGRWSRAAAGWSTKVP